MYDIRLDGKPLWYPGDNEAVIINPELHEALNDAGYIQFTVPESNPLYNDIKERISMVQVYKDDVLIFNAEVREVTVNSIKDKKVYAVGELAFLTDSIQPQQRYQNRTVLQLFDALLSEHNAQVESKKQFTRGVVTVTDANDSLYRYTNYEDTLTAMREKLCDTLDGYLRVRYQDGVRYLDFVTLDDYGKTCQQPIKFGANLLEYASNSTGADIATAVIPLGAKLEESEIEGLDAYTTIKSVNGGKDYIYSQEAVEQFGWIRKVVNWDDVTEPANLLKKANAWLEQNQFANLTLELKALDLSILSEKMESMELGDRIRAIAEPYGMDTWFPLQEKVTYFQHPENNKLTLSNTASKTYTSQANKANAELKQEIPQQKSLVQMMQENASKLIKAATNGNIVMKMDEDGNPVELLIMDTKDISTAKNVWRWNLNGFGYSSTGYNGNYNTAITMDGKIVADFIAAGTMYADRIKGGTLTLGGTNNDNGILRILNSNNEEVGRWDKDGITLPDNTRLLASQIFGGVLTLGGENNQKALMRILDSDNNQIGKWDKDGIAANKGDIAGWILDSNALYKNSNVIGTRDAKYMGEDGLSVSNYFMVNNNGLFAKNTNYEGDIYQYGLVINKYPYKTSNEYKEIVLKIRNMDVSEYDYAISFGVTNSIGIQRQEDILFDGVSNTFTYEYDEYYKEYILTFNVLKLKDYAGIDDSSTINYVIISVWEDATKLPQNGEGIREAKVIYSDLTERIFEGTVIDKSAGIVIDMERNKIEADSFKLTPEVLHMFKDFAIRAHEMWQLEGEDVMRLDKDQFMHKGIANASATSSGTVLRIDSDGTVHKYSSSSQRYKDDITAELSHELDPHKLYDINVVQFKYKDKYLTENDLRCRKDIIGFLAEDIAEKYPIACSYKDGVPEMWEVNILFPALLKLVQEQNERIKKLEEAVLNGRC